MPDIRTLATLPDGTVLRGYEVDFETVKETWDEYQVDGDIRLRTRYTLLKAFLLVNSDDQLLLDDLGEPQVYINGTLALTAKKIKVEE